MTVSVVIVDPRSTKRTPDHICCVRHGAAVEVLRGTRDAVERQRDHLLAEGAVPA